MKTTFVIKAAALMSALCVLVGGFATAAAADSIYPSQLLKDKPTLQSQYDRLIKPIAAEHAWVKTPGTETPVTTAELNDTQYAVLSSCKPHDCAGEQMVSLMTPDSAHAVGALLVNQGDGAVPTSSTLTWLGKPDARQRQFMAAYLFR